MPLSITALTPPDIPGAITCIQRAFEADDPFHHWAFDRRRFSYARNRASLHTRCTWGIQHALFHVAKDPANADPEQVLGIACWLPPALASPAPPPLSWSAWLWSWADAGAWRAWAGAQYGSWSLYFNQLATNVWHGGHGGLIVRRYYQWKEAQATAQKELWDDPEGYYFCNIVTVLPEAQGKGVGRALMDLVLQRADMEGRKCYLESSRNVPNVPIYERMGFKLVREMLCKDGEDDPGITLYCMIREPQTRV